MGARFETPLVIEALRTAARKNGRLARRLVYRTAAGERIVVPDGFRTDLASIPQVAQAIIGVWESHASAAVVHDWLYVTHAVEGRPIARARADQIFREAMAACGTGRVERWVMWAAVRIGGARGWAGDYRGRAAMADDTDDVHLTYEIMRKLAPQGDEATLRGWALHGPRVFKRHGVGRVEAAHLLATIGTETQYRFTQEKLDYDAGRLLEVFPRYVRTRAQAERLAHHPQDIANTVYANRLGNGPPSSGDGWRFRGLGDLQATGKDWYLRLGKALGVDLIDRPDQLLTFPARVEAAVIIWRHLGADKPALRGDLVGVRKAINCGSAKSKCKPNGLENARTWTRRALALVAGAEARPSIRQAAADRWGTTTTTVAAVPAAVGTGAVAIDALRKVGEVARDAETALSPLMSMIDTLQQASPLLALAVLAGVVAWGGWAIWRTAQFKLTPAPEATP